MPSDQPYIPSVRDGNPRGEIVQDGAATIESVGDYLAAMHVSCGLIGSYRTPAGRVHQHDATCLVQAGRESVLPALRQAEEKVVDYRHRVKDLSSSLGVQTQEVGRLQDHLSRAVLRNRAMETFMRTMPGIGPYPSVWDMWLEHEEERAEEALAERDRQ